MTQRTHRSYTSTLAANEELTLQVPGRQVVCLASTGTFSIKLGDEGAFGDFAAGLTRTLADADSDFGAVRIRDTSGASNTIQLSIGFGDVRDSRLNLTAPIDINGADTIVTAVDVSAADEATTQIVAASSGRFGVELTNLSTTVTLRIGDSNAAAGRGVELAPGETRLIRTSAALFAYNPSGAAVDVGVMELRN
jgi:hypothetical protein